MLTPSIAQWLRVRPQENQNRLDTEKIDFAQILANFLQSSSKQRK